MTGILSRHAISRREFLGSSAALAGASGLSLLPEQAHGREVQKRPKVAAIFTVLRFRSHAYNILENFLGPYLFRGKLVDPGVDVVAFYADQFPDDDMAREVSQRFKIPLYKSIDKALCQGGTQLAVDAVLSIAEHGDYPFNDRGQHLYPRKRFFDESMAVMKRSNKFVPFFNDKHYSYRWDWAKEMYDVCRANKMPLLGGSSVPLAQRKPQFALPMNADISEAVSVHGGGLETYDFHGLEVLQSLVEARKGGETGIASVELCIGKKFELALRAGRWPQDLVDAAMNAEKNMQAKRQPRPTTGVFRAPPKSEPTNQRPARPSGPHAIIVTYSDGLKATVLKVGSSSDRWNFACRVKGQAAPRAMAIFNSPWGNRGLFKGLSHAIQRLFIDQKEPYPAERTLLTTGAVEAVMQSYENDGAVIKTPHLNVKYQTADWSTMRENGDTWKIITPDSPQPTTFKPRSFSELGKRD
jgi:hypothetical protein